MKIVIIGAGSTARVVYEILISSHEYNLVGFVGNNEDKIDLENKKKNLPIPYLGERPMLSQLKTQNIRGFIVAVANNFIREKIFYEAINSGLTPINAISNRAIIENTAKIHEGTIIKAGAIVSHSVEIGSNCLLDHGAIISGHTTVHNHCNIGAGSIIGTGSFISKNVILGFRSIVPKDSKIGKNQIIEDNQTSKDSLPDLYRTENIE